jgi:hypothetical protein
MVFCRHKRPVLAIHGEQIRHHLSSYRQRGAIGIALLFFFFIDQGQFGALLGPKLRGFDQYTLNVFVALLGKRGLEDSVC